MGDAYERGLILYRHSRYAMAADEFRSASVSDPSSPETFAMLGLSLLRIGGPADAEASIERALHLGPDEAFPHYARAVLLREQARFTSVVGRWLAWPSNRRRAVQARDHARIAASIEPSDPDYFALLSDCEIRLGRWAAAEAAGRCGLALQPGHGECGIALAVALTESGRWAEGGEAATEALRCNPDSARVRYVVGWVFARIGRSDLAECHALESLRLEPNHPGAERLLRRAQQPPVIATVLGLSRNPQPNLVDIYAELGKGALAKLWKRTTSLRTLIRVLARAGVIVVRGSFRAARPSRPSP